jgi:Tfp pilus assembly protein PilN
MIRTNLSTRPFYNVRAVQLGIALLAVVVGVVTVLNAAQFIRLSSSQRTLGAQAQAAEEDAARLRAEAARIRARIDPKELEVVGAAAREANGIIDRRAFSWTTLFTQFESTLPPDVRVTVVTPQLRANTIGIGVEARSVEDLDAFIEALETTGAFRDVIAIDEVATEDDTIAANIEATYEPAGRRAEAAQ